MKKKIVTTALMVTLAISMAGCGNKDEKVDKDVAIEVGDSVIEDADKDVATEVEANADEEVSKAQSDIEVSEQEKEALTLLAQYTAATRWGENLEGYSITPDETMVSNFLGRLSNENFSYYDKDYDKYLPEQSKSSNEMAYSLDAMNKYSKSVFGVGIGTPADIFFYEESGLYVPIEFQYPSYDECTIKQVDIQENGTYLVKGIDSFMEWDESVMDVNKAQSYAFQMTVSKNEESPFGYSFEKIEFEAASASDIEAGSLQEVLLHPAKYKEFYPEDVNADTIYFAAIDINDDGQNEVLVSDKWLGDSPDRIINLLGMKDGKVVDLDGDKQYQRLQDWFLTESGILVTQMGVGDNQTYYYDLNSGKEWEAYTAIMTEGGTSAMDRTGVKFTKTPEGNVLEGEEVAKLNRELTNGGFAQLSWEEVTEENIRNAFGN